LAHRLTREIGDFGGHMSSAAVHRKLRFGSFELSIGERILRRDGQALRLGDRALDILIYLADRPGEVIAKQELIDHVWPGVTVEEGSIRVRVAAIRKALGHGEPGNRYIANIKGRGYSFVGTVVPLTGNTESRNGKFRHQGRLPMRPLVMIGRETVVSKVSDKLRNERFVTLLGPGGIGKTTIALAVGRAVVEEFGGEVYFVDLESLADPRHVTGAVATSLGLALKSKDLGLELINLVRSRKLLIILDCCEHVIETVAPLAQQLCQETDQAFQLLTGPLNCPPPTGLTITRSGSSVMISWPVNGFMLQSTPVLANPSSDTPWVDVTTGSPFSESIVAGQNRFYRLICP